MNKGDLAEKLKDELDRKCHRKLWGQPGRVRHSNYCGPCGTCERNLPFAQEPADIAEQHYKAERKVEA